MKTKLYAYQQDLEQIREGLDDLMADLEDIRDEAQESLEAEAAAAIKADIARMDAALARLVKAADEYGYTLLITADHGNADQMTETKKSKTSIRTAHSLNPVPFIIYDPDNTFVIRDGKYGLANVAPTVVKMMGLTAPDCWEASMI